MMKRKFLIQGKADHRSVWIMDLDSNNRYQLPLAEYVSKYKRDYGSTPTGFEWGYEGSGPKFLAWALADELLGSEATKEQSDYIDQMVMGVGEHERDFEFTLVL